MFYYYYYLAHLTCGLFAESADITAIRASLLPALISPSLWFAEFNYLSPIKSFQSSLDHLSAVVVYHARLSAQTLFLEIGCYYL